MLKVFSFILDEYGDDIKNTEVIATYISHRSRFHYVGVNWISYTTHTRGTCQDESLVRYMEIFVRVGPFAKQFTLIDKPRPEEYLAYREEE